MGWGKSSSGWHKVSESAGGASYPDFTGNAGLVLAVNGDEDGVEWAAAPAAAAAGSDTEITFNDGGTADGTDGLTWTKASKALGLVGPLTLTPATDIVPLTVRASADPGTAHIVQWQESDNTALGHIAHDGTISAPGLELDAPLPYTSGGTGLATLGTAGQALVVNGTEDGLEFATGGGGITNSAGANVIPKSDGTNLVASRIEDDGTNPIELDGYLNINHTSGADRYAFGGTEFSMTSGLRIGWTSGTSTGTPDTLVRRRGAANPAWGVASATPVAYTHSLAADARAGTDSNVAGANAIIAPGVGTGDATGSTLTIQTPAAGASGTTAQTLTTRLVAGPTGINIPNLAEYADNAAAVTGGLVTGDLYRTSTGVLMVVLP